MPSGTENYQALLIFEWFFDRREISSVGNVLKAEYEMNQGVMMQNNTIITLFTLTPSCLINAVSSEKLIVNCSIILSNVIISKMIF